MQIFLAQKRKAVILVPVVNSQKNKTCQTIASKSVFQVALKHLHLQRHPSRFFCLKYVDEFDVLEISTNTTLFQLYDTSLCSDVHNLCIYAYISIINPYIIGSFMRFYHNYIIYNHKSINSRSSKLTLFTWSKFRDKKVHQNASFAKFSTNLVAI